MKRTVIFSLVLTAILLVGLWPVAGVAEEPAALQGLVARLQAKLGRLQSPEINELLARLLQEVHQTPEIPNGSVAPNAVTAPPGFYSYTQQSGLTDVRGYVVYPSYTDYNLGFYQCFYFVEQSLNRVSASCGGSTVTPFATGLSTPTDLLASPSASGPFGNFLYVTESGANRISKISPTGAVTPFASLTSAPKRMAFSPVLGAFAANVLFVTLADGRIVTVNPSGTVSPCASGLSSPEGLVFGPGGSAFKTVLFVAEATANRISKMTPACTVTSFASTGLTSPLGLEISPGGAWGPLDTLYVVNAGTRVDRVDKNGNVTSFATGLGKGDTVRFNFYSSIPLSERIGVGGALYVSDTTAGTLTQVYAASPYIFTQLAPGSCNPCRAGDTLSLTATVQNPTPLDLLTEIKAGFRLIDGTPVTFAPLLGNNRHFEIMLPKGFSFQGPWLSLLLPVVPPGMYCYDTELSDAEVTFYPWYSWRTCFTVLP